MFLLVGYHTDWDLMERAGIALGDTNVPHYDPETFETNVPGLFLAGGAICGRDTSKSSSRTAGSTARRSSRPSPAGCRS